MVGLSRLACTVDAGKARNRGDAVRPCGLLVESWSRAGRADLKRTAGTLGIRGGQKGVSDGGNEVRGVSNQPSLQIGQGTDVGMEGLGSSFDLA